MKGKQDSALRESIIKRAVATDYYKSLWSGAFSVASNFYDLPLASDNIFKLPGRESALAVDEKQISYFFFSGGSTNRPKMIPFTKEEWCLRSRYRKACYESIGIQKSDRVAVILPFGPWVAGQSAQDALFQLGCKVFPLGPVDNIGQMEAMLPVFDDHNINVIVTAPSYGQKIIFYLEKLGASLKIEKAVTSGEYVSVSLRKLIVSSLRAEVFSSYAMSEGFVGIECNRHDGFHYNPEEIHIDIVGQETYKPINGVGLVLVTVFSSQAIPLVRYNTGDLGEIDLDVCPCGSRWPKIKWYGRTQETFCLAGAANIHSTQLREVLSKLSFVVDACTIELKVSRDGRDMVLFLLESGDERVVYDHSMCKKEIDNILPSISIDFNDILYHNLVEVRTCLKYRKTKKHSAKAVIRVKDKRQYVR